MSSSLVVGNWKMNGGPKACAALAAEVSRGLEVQPATVEVVLAPPFTGLAVVRQAIAARPIALAAQNCHDQESGAFTGEVSAAMLEEIGCRFVIVGHSERRRLFNESDATIARKVAAVLRHAMRPILCVGETREERERDQTWSVISRQLDSALKGLDEGGIDTVEIAYEPVWAIGTGLNAGAQQIDEIHRAIRNFLIERFGHTRGAAVRLLYGGSVNPANARMIAEIDSVDGLLVGGASLIAESFLTIVQSFVAD
ncbi:MAG TPA: triose-phosphate isomerase [Candidatus Binatia bacterium]|nr:triose-phosphate isomerase [Candidatus Binatia bacterium]